MGADIMPIKLALDDRDVYTLWAPRWRDAGDEWEAFLGKDEDLYGFDSVAELVAFVRGDTDNDLSDHPAWQTLAGSSAHSFDPDGDQRFDLIKVYELLAEKPTPESVQELAGTMAIVSAIGSVCELPAITKFFNGNPVLSSLSAGMENFSDRTGLRRWNEIGAVVDRGWDKVVDAIEEVVSAPEVDGDAVKQAEAELLEAPETEPEDVEQDAEGEDAQEREGGARNDDGVAHEAGHADEADEAAHEDEVAAEHAHRVVLGSDTDFWLKVGIDPIRMITGAGTFYTLRCYLDDDPVFLGRNGRISVFGSERGLARYLADEHDHDLSGLATYDDIRTAAIDGSLRVEVTADNVYMLTGLADDIADGPDAVDREQLELAVELLRDVGEYAEERVVEDTLKVGTPLGRLVAHVLGRDAVRKPEPPYADAVAQWERLETFLESRLRPE